MPACGENGTGDRAATLRFYSLGAEDSRALIAEFANQRCRTAPMADDKFFFAIQLAEGVSGSFAECSGLTADDDPVNYRAGVSDGAVTLRRGTLGNAGKFRTWYEAFAYGATKRASVAIDVRDRSGSTLIRWRLTKAWPMKYTGPALNSEGNDVAIEELVLVHEGLEIIAAS
jgi:phage tail-like protein